MDDNEYWENEAIKLERELDETNKENERLRQQLEQLQADNRRMREALENIIDSPNPANRFEIAKQALAITAAPTEDDEQAEEGNKLIGNPYPELWDAD